MNASQNTKRVIGREIYLDTLISSKNNICLVGPLNIGKTSIIKKFLADSNALYVDFDRVGFSPEDFAVSFITSLAGFKLGKNVMLDDCGLNEESSIIVDSVKNELLKIKPDHKLLVKLAFSYAKTLGKKGVVVCIDEFWKILDMNNFGQIGGIVPYLKKIFLELKNTRFILTGSAVKVSRDISSELGFETIEVLPLKLRDVKDDELHHYSGGVPLYVNAISSRIKEKYSVREAFLIESLYKQGVIYNSCKFKLNDSLSRARGKALLLSILRVLVGAESMRLNEIAKGIYRSSSVTKNLLTRLIDVDLVVKDGNQFRFSDDILKFWYKLYLAGTEFDFLPDKKSLSKIEVDL